MTYLRTAVALSLPLVCLSFTVQASAQATRPIASVERRIQTMDQQSRQYEIENMGRDEKTPQFNAKRSREIKNEIAEDLNSLQTIYNEIVLTLQDKTEPSPTVIQASFENVKKRATRLKTNLVLPKPAETALEKDTSITPVELPKKGLRSLAKLIYELITNPIFESTAGLDVKLAGKATQDLDTLIAFSSASVSQ